MIPGYEILRFIRWCREKHFTLQSISEEDIKEIVCMYFEEMEEAEQ